jgi:endonuclease/exonuclease/phosphatase family metal-dependent hydrolase
MSVKLNDSCLKLGCLNIEKYRHIERIIPALCENDLDVICLQEVPEDMVGRIAQALGASAYYVATWRVWREDVELEKAFGLAVLVRRGAAVNYDESLYHAASVTDRPHPHNGMLQYVTIEKDGLLYHIGNTHFRWTPNGMPTLDQYRDMSELLGVIETKIYDADIVLCGDFNAPRGGPLWEKLSVRFRDSVPPFIVTTLDQEYHRAAPIFLVVDGMSTSAHYSTFDVEVVGGLSDHMLIAGKVARVLY